MAHMPTLEEFNALQQALANASRHIESLSGQLLLTRAERDLLQEQLNRFKRKLFAASSEVTGQHQKDMFFNEAESLGAQAEPAAEETENDKIEVPSHKRVKRGRKPLNPALAREVVRHELPESERICPHDGATLREISVQVSEQLDIIPQQVRVIRHERVKYACPCCDGALRLAERPAQIIPKGLFTESALAWMVTAKYLDGLPLYRQAALLERFGGNRHLPQHGGWQHPETGTVGSAGGEPAARRAAGRAHGIWRRNRAASAQGAWAQCASQELYLGADDRWQWTKRHGAADPVVQLCQQPLGQDGAGVVRRYPSGSGADDRWLRRV